MMTKHAAVRAQQRCIPLEISMLLDQFGERHYNGNGVILRYFSKASIRNMLKKQSEKLSAKIKHYFDVYKVVSVDGGNTITIGYRTKRIKRR
ncbi:MAG: hypothetical protein Q7T40_08150 [Methylobacter sp.]|nr:hypothetical protein [Methylobacter sp.]